jgi:5-methylcytosine-specific restriction endonuclease McrA
LEGLNLSEEEKEYQLNQWVDDSYLAEITGTPIKVTAEKKSKAINQKVRNQNPIRPLNIKKIVEKVPPLSQDKKEEIIQRVGTKCCYPNCDEMIALDVHHIVPREEGGLNRDSNLIVLCPVHHRLADRGAIPRNRLKRYNVKKIELKNNLNNICKIKNQVIRQKQSLKFR